MTDSSTQSLLSVRATSLPLLSKEVSQVISLCRKYLREGGEEYAQTSQRWDFLYRENPERISFHSLLSDTQSQEIVGHFGLFPIPLKSGKTLISSAGVSNAVIASHARNLSLAYQGIDTFPILSLIGDACSLAFQRGVEVVIAFSSIPAMIWRIADFESVTVPLFETLHVPFGRLLRNAIMKKSLRAAVIALLIRLGGWKRLFYRTRSDIRLLEVGQFDQALDRLSDLFCVQNEKLLTYGRTAEFFNWRFQSSLFRKFLVFSNEQLVGSVVVLKESVKDFGTIAKIEDLFLIESALDALPQVLRHLQKAIPGGFSWEQYLSCDVSKKMALVAAECGDVRVPGYRHALRNLFGRKYLGHGLDLYFKIREGAPNALRMRNALEGENFQFSPLFYVPCPYFLTPAE